MKLNIGGRIWGMKRYISKRNILILLAAFVVIIVGLITWTSIIQFLPAEATLQDEFSKLDLPTNIVLISSEYKHGNCLDNCPALGNVYLVNDTRESIGQMLRVEFEGLGYEVKYGSGTLSAQKGKVDVLTVLKPRLGTGTLNYSTNLEQQNQIVTELRINYFYIPN